MNRKPKEPTTPEEWRECVDLAAGALGVDDCRMYGLIEGGPIVDRARCFDILERGQALGYKPHPKAALRFVLACNAPADAPNPIRAVQSKKQ